MQCSVVAIPWKIKLMNLEHKYILSEINSKEVTFAYDYAKEAHKGQLRKYTNEPYINHPVDVAYLIYKRGFGINAIIAALLHDVVEDTLVTKELLSRDFDDNVVSIVIGLTEFSRKEDGNRAFRKMLDRRFLSLQSFTVQSIKLADMIDNTKSIVEYDPAFAKIYMSEKRDLLQVLKKSDRLLFDIANAIVSKYYEGSKIDTKNLHDFVSTSMKNDYI